MSKGRSLLEGQMLQDRTVLLVDNDRAMVETIRDILEDADYNVIPAYCGLAAIDKVTWGHYRCAILDYALPDMKGDKLAERLRQIVPDMGIILLTGFKSMIDASTLAGFRFVLEKPVSIQVLISALDEITGVHIREHERKQALISNRYSRSVSARARQGT